MKRFLILAMMLLWPILIVTGCGSTGETSQVAGVTTTSAVESESSSPEATATTAPSPTAPPTESPTPTETPTPTSSPTPTATPTPEPELLVRITDATSGEPVVGANIVLSVLESGLVMTLQSDDEGEALFDSLADGDFSLSVSAEGFYEEIVEEISVTGPDEMEFAMTGVAIAEVVAETADLRSGPGGVYAHEGQIEEGDSVEIVSQNEAGDWYLVSVGDDDETAWVNGEDVSVSGSMDRVEVVAPPPTPTSAPAATAAQPTETESSEPEPGESETTEEPEAPDTVVLYYISDPNEILGIFPVRPFDPAEELAKMQLIRGALYTMRDALPGARSGDAAACANYINAYNNVLYSGIYYDPVPPEWQDIDEVYYISFVYALDRTRPAYLSCVDSGRVDDFNAGLAEQSIGQTLAFLEPAINEAAARQ